MASTSYRSRNHDAPPLRRRAPALALALAIEILLILAFLSINFRTAARPEFKGSPLAIFDLASDDAPKADRSQQKPAQTTKAPPRPVPPTTKPTPPLPVSPLAMLVVSKEVYAASDISKLGSNAPGAAAAQGSSAGDSERVGTGPHGEPLYAAEWYREPTDRELAGYLPQHMPDGGGWGLVACRTVAAYHVDDCIELGNSPPGSHLASAVRQAAWQFLVRPPRVGGREQVGEWVRIRVDYDIAKTG